MKKGLLALVVCALALALPGCKRSCRGGSCKTNEVTVETKKVVVEQPKQEMKTKETRRSYARRTVKKVRPSRSKAQPAQMKQTTVMEVDEEVMD